MAWIPSQNAADIAEGIADVHTRALDEKFVDNHARSPTCIAVFDADREVGWIALCGQFDARPLTLCGDIVSELAVQSQQVPQDGIANRLDLVLVRSDARRELHNDGQ